MDNQITRGQFLKTLATASMGAQFAGSPFVAEAKVKNTDNQRNESDFPVRGFHIDLRSEVMTISALKEFANVLASLGINTIVMEYEATYPYKNNLTLRNKNAYSREEIKDYITHCSKLNIDVVPLQESLGHVQYILRHDKYADLRISRQILSQVDPLNKKAIQLFKELIGDMISLHDSPYVHIGGDEVRHLTNKKFHSYVEKHGISKLYTQYMKQICQIVIDHGKTPLLWADMILKHPEAVEDLPIDKAIFIDWNYGWNINMFGNISALQKKGCTFWGAPALRSSPDNYFITRWEKHFNNLRDYIPYSRKSNYKGMIMTSWSTSGIYGYKWEDNDGQLLEMFPIRNVYPLSGFHILVEAFAKSLQEDKSLKPQEFVMEYAQKRYGLNRSDAEKLWTYFAHKQILVREGHPDNHQSISQLVQNFGAIKQKIDEIKPQQNIKEFEHFKLMAAIREFYLQGLELQEMMDSYDGKRENRKKIQARIGALSNNSEILNKRFIALNHDFLKNPELKRLNDLRNERLHNLKERYDNFIFTSKYGESTL
ncbi:MAG TPA: family 20 glycosylhydrolase [Balneolales bacterium]|nr:family 20 glycosylhydrolase [Balneolales bacterium]